MNQVLWFGAAALTLLAFVQAVRFWKGPQGATFNPVFTKSFGLILVATLGVALALSGTDVKDANGAYTLLGIIAGYLAGTSSFGTKPPTSPGQPPP
jgi:hypothetical protein